MKIELKHTPGVEEVRPNIFFYNHIQYNKDKEDENDRFKAISLKEIVKLFGYETSYEDMIEILYSHIRNKPDLIITVRYDSGSLSYEKDKQKLLFWSIYNERTQQYGLCGGVLFQNDEMSFHT